METLLHWLLGFPVGLLLANLAEWLIHKYVLHGLGRDKNSFWAFHWHDHHGESRRHAMRDPAYESASLLAWNSRTKELAALAAGLPLYALLLPHAPGLAAAFTYATCNYYYKHRRAHRDPEWAERHLPWHVDHHLGPNQDANWCVTRPWADHLFGTRERYLGTERAAQRAQRLSRLPA